MECPALRGHHLVSPKRLERQTDHFLGLHQAWRRAPPGGPAWTGRQAPYPSPPSPNTALGLLHPRVPFPITLWGALWVGPHRGWARFGDKGRTPPDASCPVWVLHRSTLFITKFNQYGILARFINVSKHPHFFFLVLHFFFYCGKIPMT